MNHPTTPAHQPATATPPSKPLILSRSWEQTGDHVRRPVAEILQFGRGRYQGQGAQSRIRNLIRSTRTVISWMHSIYIPVIITRRDWRSTCFISSLSQFIYNNRCCSLTRGKCRIVSPKRRFLTLSASAAHSCPKWAYRVHPWPKESRSSFQGILWVKIIDIFHHAFYS